MCGIPFACRIASTFRCSTSTTDVPPCGGTTSSDVEPVDVQRLVAEAIGDLLALDHQELLVGAVKRVQSVDRRQEVVIRQHEELVTMLPVPADDIIRRRVAVAIERMCMRVAFVPAAGVLRWSGLLLYRDFGAAHRDDDG